MGTKFRKRVNLFECYSYRDAVMLFLRPILDAVLKQGVLRLFQHGFARLCFRRRKHSRAEATLLVISNQR